MIYRRFVPMVLFFTTALMLRAKVAAEEPSQRSQKPAFYVGVCAHFGQNKGIPRLNLAMMKAAGINSLRDELSWGSVEHTRGGYAVAPDKSDTFRRAAEMRIEPMLIFDYANRNYDQGDRPRSPEAVEGYTRYAEFLVKYFGSDIRLYEVWNEYDIGIGMPEPFRKGGSPEDYVKMLKHTYPRVKKLDPQITVVGGACTGGAVHRGWLEGIVKLGALDYCDVLSIHTYNYSAPGAGRTPEACYAWMREVQAMLRKYNKGHDVPLFITEMGWPTHVGKSNSTPPELSASYLGRLYLLARTLPPVRGVWWYDYQDDGWDAEHNEHNFGILRADLTPKPSYYVMADVAELVKRGEFQSRVKTEDPALWILRFRLDGEPVWAVWSADDKPRQILLETSEPEGVLLTGKLGRPTVRREWGYRAWASRGHGSKLVPNQAALVVDDRPWLLRGAMDAVRLAGATDKVGAVAEKVAAP